MSTRRLDGVSWSADAAAHSKGESGIDHSYVASLATGEHRSHLS